MLDYRKLFDVGEKITLSPDFYNHIYVDNSWQQDCINAQKKYGFLKIVSVEQNYIEVEGVKSTWALTLPNINLYQLEPYKDNYEILYAFADNQARLGKKRNISCPLHEAFIWQNTLEGYTFWDNIFSGKYLKSKEFKEFIETSKETKQTIQNNNNHEIRLQKQKASIIRGTRPEGNRIRSSKHKASIRSGQISYTACHC